MKLHSFSEYRWSGCNSLYSAPLEASKQTSVRSLIECNKAAQPWVCEILEDAPQVWNTRSVCIACLLFCPTEMVTPWSLLISSRHSLLKQTEEWIWKGRRQQSSNPGKKIQLLTYHWFQSQWIVWQEMIHIGTESRTETAVSQSAGIDQQEHCRVCHLSRSSIAPLFFLSHANCYR